MVCYALVGQFYCKEKYELHVAVSKDVLFSYEATNLNVNIFGLNQLLHFDLVLRCF